MKVCYECKIKEKRLKAKDVEIQHLKNEYIQTLQKFLEIDGENGYLNDKILNEIRTLITTKLEELEDDK